MMTVIPNRREPNTAPAISPSPRPHGPDELWRRNAMKFEDEKRVINRAVRDLVKSHVQRGGSAAAISEGLIQVGLHAMCGELGAPATAQFVHGLGNKIEADPRLPGHAPPTPKSENETAAYIATVLDAPPPGHDRDALQHGALVHAALSLTAMHGADVVVDRLTDLARQIAAGAAAGELRAGARPN
jgi:hypothetical protein